jgi:hypothetical protein
MKNNKSDSNKMREKEEAQPQKTPASELFGK